MVLDLLQAITDSISFSDLCIHDLQVIGFVVAGSIRPNATECVNGYHFNQCFKNLISQIGGFDSRFVGLIGVKLIIVKYICVYVCM